MSNAKMHFKEFGEDILKDIRASQREQLDDIAFEERIERATAAMAEVGVEKRQIIQMLQKYWDLRLSEAKIFVKKQQKIEATEMLE